MSAERRSTALDAVGKWPGILAALGVESRFLKPKHGPCPMCGGKDRFRFDDKKGRGTWFCSQCGSGTGFDLLMLINGWTFPEAAKQIDAIVGSVKAKPIRKEQADLVKRSALSRIWSECSPIAGGDPVNRYLVARGIRPTEFPAELRCHARLIYRDGGDVMHFAAMVARVIGPDGSARTLHRTYLKDGAKAPVDAPRKLMPGKPWDGAAVRLFPVAERLGIAEGIETALAASILFDMPVWSAINAHGLEIFEPPAEVDELVIFGDADESWTGQAAAAALAKRMVTKGLGVKVRLPSMGKDWNDVLRESKGVSA